MDKLIIPTAKNAMASEINNRAYPTIIILLTAIKIKEDNKSTKKAGSMKLIIYSL